MMIATTGHKSDSRISGKETIQWHYKLAYLSQLVYLSKFASKLNNKFLLQIFLLLVDSKKLLCVEFFDLYIERFKNGRFKDSNFWRNKYRMISEPAVI
jgi:hypothetical protein